MKCIAWCFSAACAALLSFAAPAQSGSGTRVTGGYGYDHSTFVSGTDFSDHVTFDCTGEPSCSGTYTETSHNFTNNFQVTYFGTFTMTGVNLAKAGPFQGLISLAAVFPGGYSNDNYGYTATWDGTTGAITIPPRQPCPACPHNGGSFTALRSATPPPPPQFPLTVTADIGQVVVSASAQMQFRPQDVGTSGSIFVFAHAPANLVTGAAPAKRAPTSPPVAARADDAIVCVLAQVNSSGQLVAVSAATMQAYLSGVLSSYGQAVSILHHAPTSNVAGATLYVGYGTSASNMLTNGVYQAALSVPGTVQCTASLVSAPAPQTPGLLSGLWWNPNESGWGIHFTQRGGNIFAAWYTYDSFGNPKWYVASNCVGASGVSGTCSGTVYEVNGPTFFGADFHPVTAGQVSSAGNLQVNFADANNATMSFTVAGVTRTVPITRQIFPIPQTAPPAVDYTDLWWNPSQSGWGMAITHQFGSIFLAWYVYDASGKPFWYAASNCVVKGSGCTGTLYRTTGPPFGPSFDTGQIKVFTVGSAILSFIDANTAALSYTVDGASSTKMVTRQIF